MADTPDLQPIAGDQPVASNAFSARMFDHTANKWTDVPADQVDDAVKSNNFTFARGLQLPVVNDQGVMGSIPSEAAYHEFANNGVKWATPLAKQAATQQAQRDIVQQNFDSTPTALAAGTLRAATLGTSDVIADKGFGLSQALKNSAEANPIATTTGEVAGTVASALVPGGVLKNAGTAADLALSPLGSKLLTNVGREALVGGIQGLGQAVTAQSLDHPQDTLDNVASHVGSGLLFGGVAGGVLGASQVASPYLSKALDKVTGGITDTVSKVASAATAKAVAVGLGRQGLGDVGAELGQAIKDPAFVEAATKIGPQGAAKLVQDAKPVVDEANQLVKDTTADIQDYLKGASDDAKQSLNDALKQSNDDLLGASNQTQQAVLDGKQAFHDLAGSVTDPLTSKSMPFMDGYAFETAKDLKSSPFADVRNIGNKIEAQILGFTGETEGQQAQLYANLRNTVKDLNTTKLPSNVVDHLDDLQGMLEKQLTEHSNPTIAESFKQLLGTEQTADKLQEFAQAVGDRSNASSKTILDMLTSTKQQTLASTLTQHIAQFEPELKGYADSLKSTYDTINYQNALEAKLAKVLPGNTFDGADAKHLLDFLGNPEQLSQKMSQLADLQQAMPNNVSALDRVLNAKRVLRQPIADDLMTASKYARQFELLAAAKDATLPGFSMAKAVLAGGLMGTAKAAIFGSQKSSVSGYMQALGAIQKVSEFTGATLNKTVKAATKAILNPATAAAGTAVQLSVAEQRKQYKQISQQLSVPQNPPDARLPQQMQAALQQRQQLVQTFLQSKLPQDPLAATSVNAKTGYVPSDQDLAKFSRYLGAAADPASVLTKIGANKASPEEIEALKTLNPGMYHKLQDSISEAITTKQPDLNYATKLQLANVFGISTDYSLQPTFIDRMQKASATQQPQQGPGRPRKISIDLKPNSTVATTAQQATYGLQEDK